MTDRDFLHGFEDQTLPIEHWNHRAHLKVTYLLLLRASWEGTLRKLQEGIPAYNAAHGIPESPTSGYHETMTQAWVRLVFVTLHQFGPAASADAFLDAQSQLTQKRVLLLFYSRDLIMSSEAKHTFIQPDLAPLPRIPGGRG